MGICHQVNLEYLARVVFTTQPNANGVVQAYPDTLVGTDSHTTMINGLGVLGWGVGGIEAEAAMLGQPVSMLVPQVVGFKLTGKLREGATATDLVLTVTEMLRKLGVVGKFVEFYGAGISELSLADRATIAQHGAGVWRDLRHLPGRCGDAALSAADGTQRGADRAGRGLLPRSRACSTRRMRRRRSTRRRCRSILATVEPSVAGPKRPQDRVRLSEAAGSFQQAIACAAGAERQQECGAAGGALGWRGRSSVCEWKRQCKGSAGARDMPRSIERSLWRGRGQVSRSRVDRDCGDYELHEYVESIGDDGGGFAGEEGCGEGIDRAAVGEDLAGAGLARGDGLLQQGRIDAISRQAALQRGRLRLHDVHWQLRPAADRCVQVD